jgi:hypothetical protein
MTEPDPMRPDPSGCARGASQVSDCPRKHGRICNQEVRGQISLGATSHISSTKIAVGSSRI